MCSQVSQAKETSSEQANRQLRDMFEIYLGLGTALTSSIKALPEGQSRESHEREVKKSYLQSGKKTEGEIRSILKSDSMNSSV